MFSIDAESSILQAMSFFLSTEQGHVERALKGGSKKVMISRENWIIR